MEGPQLAARDEHWPLADPFVIARGAKTEAHVVVAELAQGGHVGRGEAVPYARYGESVGSVLSQMAGGPLDRAALQTALPPGAARNALDCALWDLEAKTSGRRVHERTGLLRLDPVKTAFTLSLGAPDAMAAQARTNATRPMLKLKIGGADDVDRVRAVRQAAPKTRLIVDANEALDFDTLRRISPELAALGVLLIEQPLPQGSDAELEGWDCPVRLCADESLHTRAELEACARRYACVNIKLDKAGGLTEALALKREARALGLDVMVGCMVATSLAMAPALILAQGAAFVDLDGPLLLSRDREPGLTYLGSAIMPPEAVLWG